MNASGRRHAVKSPKTRRQRGQSTIEAAVLLPTLMLIFALLVEPVCLGYTTTVMHVAAAGAARAVATDYDGSFDDCKAYALRRLKAVPEASIFHVGGEDDWDIQMTRSDALGSSVHVEITGHARPLPLLGLTARMFGQSDGTGVVLRAVVDGSFRPGWVGGDYAEWQEVWG